MAESVAKKLCFAGKESGVGFVVARKKHVETCQKTRDSGRTFPLWKRENTQNTRKMRLE